MSKASPLPELSPNDALPPVEPPSAGFILQLFVVPGVIVVVIVMVWLMFSWLAQMGNDPELYVKALERNNEARWQAAVHLADALREERSAGRDALKHNTDIVRRLSATLDREIEAGSMQEQPVTLRIFLCRVLGEFSVPNGLPELLKAARVSRGEAENAVRSSALEAIALLSENVRADSNQKLADPVLDSTLIKCGGDSDRLVRSAAAYCMGVLGGAPLTAKLRDMLEDIAPDVRYNAATGLARHGDSAAVPVLIEMLDPNELAGVEAEQGVQSEQKQPLRQYKQGLIIVNALRAVSRLLQVNSSIDRGPLEAAVEKLSVAEVDPKVRGQAGQVLDELRKSRAD